MAKSTMWWLLDRSKNQAMNEQERRELQKRFVRVAVQDVRVSDDEGLLESDETDSRT